MENFTDFDSHHIEGWAHAAPELGEFKVPLISHVEGNLWQGGCIDRVQLPDNFKYVLSLYRWESYIYPEDCVAKVVTMYDSGSVPDQAEIDELANYVNRMRDNDDGDVLVHCQAGLNRSGLIAARSLMLRGATADEAITKLRESRCAHVLCNKAFEAFLRLL